MAMRFTITKGAVQWILDKIKSIQSTASRVSTVTGGADIQTTEQLKEMLFEPINLAPNETEDVNLDELFTAGRYYVPYTTTGTKTGMPGVVNNGWVDVMPGYLYLDGVKTMNACKQIMYRQGTINTNDYQIYVRTWSSAAEWGDWTLFGKVSGGTASPSGGSNGDVYIKV